MAADTAEQHQAAQAAVAVLLARELAKAWRLLDVTALAASLPRFIAAVAGLVNQYGAASAAVAADYYTVARAAARVSGRYTVVPATPPDLERVEPAVRWATGALWTPGEPEAPAQALVEGAAETMVADTARDTIIQNTHADPKAKAWARVPEPTACSFCMLLAQRGAVYKEQTVKFRAHAPRIDKHGNRVGGTCQCHAEPVFAAYKPSARIRAAQGLYSQVTHSSPAAMRREFRRLYEASQR